jgi:hypothetical protein
VKDHTLSASLFGGASKVWRAPWLQFYHVSIFCKDASVARPMQHSDKLEIFLWM